MKTCDFDILLFRLQFHEENKLNIILFLFIQMFKCMIYVLVFADIEDI